MSDQTQRVGRLTQMLERARGRLDAWLGRWLGGHIRIGPVTFYGRNAMHFAVNIKSRWGWICFKPPTRCFGVWWPAYFYISEDATPFNCRVYWGRTHR